MGDVVSLETLINYYESAAELSYDNRLKCERDRDFYDGKQWTQEEHKNITNRGETPVVVNKIAGKVDWMLGTERQLRADPKAFPRTPKHEDAAHAVTDALRYVVDNQNFDAIASDAAEHLFIEGIESVSVEVEPKGRDFEILIRPIKWDRYFYDPHSRRRDFSDAKYQGYVTWMDMEDAKAMFPKKSGWLQRNMNSAEYSDTYDDKPSGKWYDRKRNRVMIITIYFLHKGKWHNAVFTRGLYLFGPEPSAYLDDDGLPECCIIAQSAKMDRDGNRYGAARQYIDPQKELNKRRSKFLHLLSRRQVIREEGAVKDSQAMKRELAKPDGDIVVEPGLRFEIQDTGDMGSAQFNLYQAASAEIDGMGANPALQGKHEGEASGVALERREQGGLTEMGPFFDAHRIFKRRIYRAIWHRIKQYWPREKWIRVTDTEENLKWVGLNVPVTRAEQLLMERTGLSQHEVRQQGGQMLEQLITARPEMGQIVETANEVAKMDIDIVLDESPNSVTLQSEEFGRLVEMYLANPQGVPWEMIVEASSLRSKQKLLETYKPDPQQEEAAAQAQQEERDIAKANAMAEIENKRADTAKKMASARKDDAQAGLTMVEAAIAQAFPDVAPNVII